MKIFEMLKKHNVDAVLVNDFANMRYFFGFTGEGYCLAVADKIFVFTDSRYTIATENETKAFNAEVVTIKTGETYPKLIKSYLDKFNVNKVGFEGEYLYFNQYDSFNKAFSGLELVNLGSSLDKEREIKTKEEIEFHRIAEGIGDKAFSKILTIIRPGMTELQVAAEIEMAFKEYGASGPSFDTIVASGLNGALPHAVPSDKKIEEGDFVTMDFGCKYNGYCSDMTRTIVVGKASDKQKEIYDIVLKAQLAGLAAVKDGVNCKLIDKASRDIIAEAGYGANFGHGLGHSVGLKIHENPRFSPLCDETVRENMIMTVEPGIYIADFGGVRIEDTVAVTKDGIDNLAHSPKELLEINNK